MNRFWGSVDHMGLHGDPPPRECEDLQFLFCGYVANRGELLDEARRRGEALDEPGDGELLARASRWWEIELPARVVGQFSLVVYDGRNKSLLLVHDALGLSPLFYNRAAGGLRFASRLAELVPQLDDRTLDEEYLADYLANCGFLGTRTPYKSAQRLGVGEAAVWRDGRLSRRQVWSLCDLPPLELADDREYEARFRELLCDGVAAALRAPGPVWSELSGGLDSSSITSIAAGQGAANFAAFSFVFQQHARTDEAKWIQHVLDQYHVDWRTLDGDQHLPYTRYPDRFCGEPRFSLINWGWLMQREELLAENRVAALLTGQGGDLVCLGVGSPPYHLADPARWMRPWRTLGELRRWQAADTQRRSLLYWLLSSVASPKLRHLLRRPVLRFEQAEPSPWLDADFARRMQLAARGQQLAVSRCRGVGRQWFWESVCSMCSQVANQNQDAHGFELRHPFLHRPLVEFMAAIPPRQKLHPEADRFLQRRALAGILPEKIRKRRGKATFDQPSFEGLRQAGEWTAALTDDPRIARLGLVDRERWIEAVGQARMGLTHNLPQFVAAATLEVLLRQLERLAAPGGLP
jgi:asparagine synthase (glutamine-hydrolysing)